MGKLIQRRERHSADRSEQSEVLSPSEDSHSERDNSPVEHAPDVSPKTDSESEPSSSEDEQPPSSCSNMQVTPKPSRPKRSLKPVVRFTYDELGKGKDQPITIVHRGVTIKIGKQ